MEMKIGSIKTILIIKLKISLLTKMMFQLCFNLVTYTLQVIHYEIIKKIFTAHSQKTFIQLHPDSRRFKSAKAHLQLRGKTSFDSNLYTLTVLYNNNKIFIDTKTFNIA